MDIYSASHRQSWFTVYSNLGKHDLEQMIKLLIKYSDWKGERPTKHFFVCIETKKRKKVNV